MPALTKVRDIGASAGGGGGAIDFSLLQTLAAFILGGKNVSAYDATKVYSSKDTIIRINPTTGVTEVLRCNYDNVTGPFDESKWEPVSANESSDQVDSVIEDMLTLMTAMSSFVDKPLVMNHIYVDDLSLDNSVHVMNGIKRSGRIVI